jgi:xylulokinase
MFIGIDVGTFETKGVVVDFSGGIVASASRRHEISTPQPGWVEQDADGVWWADVVAIARDLTSHPDVASGRIESVTFSGIGPCVLPVDEHLSPLRPAILYGVDSRSQPQIVQLIERFGDEALFKKTGNALTSQSAGPKIKWIVDEEKEVAQRARWYLTSQSYLVAKLTGQVTIDHGTAGYYDPLYDLVGQQWDISGCEDFVSRDQLPRLGWATDIAGQVTADAACETGIPSGTPVLFGSSDSPAEAVGAGVVSPGDVMMQYGSAGFMIAVLENVKPSRKLWAAPFVFPDSYLAAAGTGTAGTATRWIADLLGLDAEDDERRFGELINLAQESLVGARGLLFLPHLSGERTPFQDAASRGVFHGLSILHGRSELARACLEGIAHSLAEAFFTFGREGIEPSQISGIGGGTKNPVLVESVSALVGLRQKLMNSNGASFGGAALGAFATGALASKEQVASWASVRSEVSVDHAMRERLVLDHVDYLELYQATRGLSHRRGTGGSFEA